MENKREEINRRWRLLCKLGDNKIKNLVNNDLLFKDEDFLPKYLKMINIKYIDFKLIISGNFDDEYYPLNRSSISSVIGEYKHMLPISNILIWEYNSKEHKLSVVPLTFTPYNTTVTDFIKSIHKKYDEKQDTYLIDFVSYEEISNGCLNIRMPLIWLRYYGVDITHIKIELDQTAVLKIACSTKEMEQNGRCIDWDEEELLKRINNKNK